MTQGIGAIIQEEFKKSGLSASQFARMINRERSLVYHLFKRQSIDTDLLYKICMVLDIDLFRLFSERLSEENVKIAAQYQAKGGNSVRKRKILLEIEVDDREFDKIIACSLSKKE